MVEFLLSLHWIVVFFDNLIIYNDGRLIDKKDGENKEIFLNFFNNHVFLYTLLNPQTKKAYS